MLTKITGTVRVFSYPTKDRADSSSPLGIVPFYPSCFSLVATDCCLGLLGCWTILNVVILPGGDRVGALTKEWGFDDSKPPSEAPGYRAGWKHPTCCFCTNHTFRGGRGSVMYSVLDSQPHENAVLIQLDEHYSVRFSSPKRSGAKATEEPCWYPNIAPSGQHAEKQVSEGLKYLRGHRQTSCVKKRTFSSQRQTGCLWLTLVLLHSKADCILLPHRLHPWPHRLHPAASQKEHYNSLVTEFYSCESALLRGLSASRKDPLVIDHFLCPILPHG